MYIKKAFYLLFTLSVILNTSLFAPQIVEEEGEERRTGPTQTEATNALSGTQREKLTALQRNVHTQALARQFIEYFGIHSSYSSRSVNYLGSVLDSLTPAELENTSSLLFFAEVVFQRYIPERTPDFTESERQFAVCRRIEEALTILRRLPPSYLQQVSTYVNQHPHLLKSGALINLFLFWYENLPVPTRLQTLDSLFTKFQRSIGWPNSPIQAYEPLYRELLRISDLEKRGRILALLTCGISDLFHLNGDFVEKVVPTLNQLTIAEIGNLQEFFAGERLEVLVARNISLPVLEYILRQESRVLMQKFLSDMVVLVTNSTPRTKEQRHVAMQKLSVEQLMRCPKGQFFGLAEELNPDPEATKALLSQYIQAPHRSLTEIMGEAPIRWYPLFHLALTMTPGDFKTFLNPLASPKLDSLKDDSSGSKTMSSEEFEYKSMMCDGGLWKLFSYPPIRLNLGQHVRFLAYVFYEDLDTGIPRLRTVQEIKDRAQWIQSQDWSKVSDPENFLMQIRVAPMQ